MGATRHWAHTGRGGAFSDAERAIARLMPLPASFQCELASERLTWAPGVFDLFGVPRDAQIDRREALTFYVPESRALLEKLRGEALATGGSFTFEAEVQGGDGRTRWMRVTADVATRNGRATHLYGVKQDITAEMQRS